MGGWMAQTPGYSATFLIAGSLPKASVYYGFLFRYAQKGLRGNSPVKACIVQLRSLANKQKQEVKHFLFELALRA